MICKNCGTKLPDYAQYCRNCGVDLQKQESFKETHSGEAPPPIPPKKPLQRIPTVLFIAIGFVAVLAIIVLFNFDRNDKDELFPENSALVKQTEAEFILYDEWEAAVPITDAETAIASIEGFSEDLGFVNPSEVLTPDTETEIGGRVYYRLQQVYEDIPVHGRNLLVVSDEDGNAVGLTGNYKSIAHMDITPVISEQEAIRAVYIHLIEVYGYKQDMIQAMYKGLTIYSLGMDPVLAYEISASGSGDEFVSCLFFISTIDGEILGVESNICTASQTKKMKGQEGSEYDIPYVEENGEQYLYDENRKISLFTANYHHLDLSFVVGPDATAGEGSLSGVFYTPKRLTVNDNNKSAIDAMGNLARVYDFFSSYLDRRQFDGEDSVLPVCVNVLGDLNAYYDSDGPQICFTVPSEDHLELSKNLDVVAHEFTHGVTGTTSNLIYKYQSGALNESISDMFGEIVEREVTGHCDWKVFSFRDCSAKASMKDYLEFPVEYDNGGVHTNSYIVNYVGYLIGKHFIGDAKKPKDRVGDFATLLYGTDVMLPADATFNEYGTIMVRMANYMNADGLLNSRDIKVIKDAFAEVGIRTDLSGARVGEPSALEVEEFQDKDDFEIEATPEEYFEIEYIPWMEGKEEAVYLKENVEEFNRKVWALLPENIDWLKEQDPNVPFDDQMKMIADHIDGAELKKVIKKINFPEGGLEKIVLPKDIYQINIDSVNSEEAEKLSKIKVIVIPKDSELVEIYLDSDIKLALDKLILPDSCYSLDLQGCLIDKLTIGKNTINVMCGSDMIDTTRAVHRDKLISYIAGSDRFYSRKIIVSNDEEAIRLIKTDYKQIGNVDSIYGRPVNIKANVSVIKIKGGKELITPRDYEEFMKKSGVRFATSEKGSSFEVKWDKDTNSFKTVEMFVDSSQYDPLSAAFDYIHANNLREGTPEYIKAIDEQIKKYDETYDSEHSYYKYFIESGDGWVEVFPGQSNIYSNYQSITDKNGKTLNVDTRFAEQDGLYVDEDGIPWQMIDGVWTYVSNA
jgi:Zn-dependent metalloprotease